MIDPSQVQNVEAQFLREQQLAYAAFEQNHRNNGGGNAQPLLNDYGGDGRDRVGSERARLDADERIEL